MAGETLPVGDPDALTRESGARRPGPEGERLHSLGARTIGGYTLIRRLGEGGMGVVYEALQQNPRRPVALKIIRGGAYVDDQAVRLFEREVQALARLKHPGVAAIYEAGRTSEGQHFFAMELVRGTRLDLHFTHETAPGSKDRAGLRRRLELFLKICEAVSYAHQRGVIHRDLKPGNLLVLQEETPAPQSAREAPGVKVLDFGLARITDGDVMAASLVTTSGTVQGTVPYMSPEQIRGASDQIDLRTDVYSLGVILYELISGELPYDLRRVSLPEAARIISNDPPKRLGARRDGGRFFRAAGEIETIVQKTLEKDAGRRYQSVAALAEDVRRYLNNQPILAQPPSSLYHLRKTISRHRIGFGFAAALLALLVAFAGTMTVQAQRIARERDRANREAQVAGQVSAFLVRLFRISQPDRARGTTITARELLDKGAGQIRQDKTLDPEVRATLLDTMGEVYTSLGMFDQARPALEEALAIRHRLDGAASSAVAGSLRHIGLLLQNEGRYAESEPHLRQALQILEKLEGPTSLNVAQLWNDTGNSQSRLGRYVDAGNSYRRAIAIRANVQGKDALEIVPIESNLAILAVRSGDLAGAESSFRSALSIYEKKLGPDHPSVALLEGNVGATLVAERKYAEAEPFYRRALAVNEKILGPDHPQVAQDLANLAETRRVLGDLNGAESDNRQALAILRKKVPPADLRLRFVLVNFATVLVKRGTPEDLREGEQLLREAVADNRQTPPPDPWDAAKAESELGGCLLAQKRYAEAEPLLTGSFPTLRDKLGINERARVDTGLDWIIELYQRTGRPALAAPYLAMKSAKGD